MSLLASALAASPAYAANVVLLDAAIRVRPSDNFVPGLPGSPPTLDLYAARNEFALFQLVLEGGSTGMTGVTLNFDHGSSIEGSTRYALWGANRGTIPVTQIHWFREGYYDTGSVGSTAESDGGLWPDVLIPSVDEIYGIARPAFNDFGDGASDVPAGENRTILVEVFVGADAWSDIYSAPLVVNWNGGSNTFNINLHVSDFTLRFDPRSCDHGGVIAIR